jgi:hypothetical protein
MDSIPASGRRNSETRRFQDSRSLDGRELKPDKNPIFFHACYQLLWRNGNYEDGETKQRGTKSLVTAQQAWITLSVYEGMTDITPYKSITNSPTPRGRVLLEKLSDSQLVKKFPAFSGTRTFINVFTNARHLSLFKAA